MPDAATPPIGKGLNFNETALKVLSNMTQNGGSIVQADLRKLIALSPSYLIVDSTVHPNAADGVNQWALGLNRLCEVIIALHRKEELELETLNETSRACAEAWSITSSWRGMERGKAVIGDLSARLREHVLDPDGLTYKGEAIYVP
ncbi:hypothetical protein M407DRAFT_25664 [Tulasnella calospora MUT 4182]|uniref:Uncharacterized protein n=1 Tax=Tulasnella calospora MUT 4182 TaxID=1051891 RepID=A0A0C3QH64_9AGAM|nr:hypothetical protein M407DRAFT_25664 [Tulasnella calospora MUT 4182]